jgi:hypothetical protein
MYLFPPEGGGPCFIWSVRIAIAESDEIKAKVKYWRRTDFCIKGGKPAVTCRVVYVTKIVGSSSDDWIY